MTAYELVLIIEPNLGEEPTAALISKVEEKIKSFGGEIKKIDNWGMRRLNSVFGNARKLTQAYYSVIFFSAETDVPKKLQSFLRVTEHIVRFSTMLAVEEKAQEIEGTPLAEGEIAQGEAGGQS